MGRERRELRAKRDCDEKRLGRDRVWHDKSLKYSTGQRAKTDGKTFTNENPSLSFHKQLSVKGHDI